MTARKTIVGLCLLCALVVSAAAAQGAAALGTTAFTCKQENSGASQGFSKAHCTPADSVASNGAFKHVAIANGTTTEFHSTNEKTTSETTASSTIKLQSVQSGIEFELGATGVIGGGTVSNSEAAGEMRVSGTGSVIFTGVEVTKPVNQNCEVFVDKSDGVTEGDVTTVYTKNIIGTTAGQGDAIKFEPDEGTVLATFFITNCKVAALNGTYELKGAVKSTSIEGATVNFTYADTTTQNTLRLRGQKAGLEGTFTFSRGVGPESTVLSPTT